MFLLSPQLLFAQNSITALDVAGTPDGATTIRVMFAQPLAGLPNGFALGEPPRIVLDFPDTANGLGKPVRDFAKGNLRSAKVVQADGRARLVLNLERMLAYNTVLDGGNLLIALQDAGADDVVASAASGTASSPAAEEADATVLRFNISGYTLEGATLLSKEEIDAAVMPFTGKDKDFSDVQRALEAVEDLYAQRGYTAVRVLLPEQELEKGNVLFRVVESHFGKIAVKDNKFVSEANVLNALPSLRSGGVPKTRQIARELKLANENPARQLNAVLKAGATDEVVDANVIVTDSNPVAWGLTVDNTGSPETGNTRLGLSWRHANLFDKDHVASLQFQMSPERPERVTVLGGGYKIPLYERGDSVEFFGGYSNVNSVVGGLSNFQGGGLMLSARYNHPLEKLGEFDQRVSFGLDWRDFKRIEQTNPPVTVLYNEIVVVPVSVAYAAQGKFAKSDFGFNASLSANLPGMNKGSASDFATYDLVNSTNPNPNYKVLRYGASYSALLGDDWQFRAALNGQQSHDVLIQGEQMRLGGVDAVRGFTEGSESGESGRRWNLEGYTPDFGKDGIRARGLVFFDAGEVETASGIKSSISAAGFGLRATFADQFSLRMDAGRIINAGNDPLQRVGDWRVHVGLAASF
jgi:hemolysin activation/secretion protein